MLFAFDPSRVEEKRMVPTGGRGVDGGGGAAVDVVVVLVIVDRAGGGTIAGVVVVVVDEVVDDVVDEVVVVLILVVVLVVDEVVVDDVVDNVVDDVVGPRVLVALVSPKSSTSRTEAYPSRPKIHLFVPVIRTPVRIPFPNEGTLSVFVSISRKLEILTFVMYELTPTSPPPKMM